MNLDELKALCENATPGPWIDHELPVLVHNSTSTIHAPNAIDVPTWSELPPEIAGVLKACDAHFIATARTALPKLIEAVEAVREITKGDLPPEGFDSYAEGFGVGQDILAQKIDEAINNALEES